MDIADLANSTSDLYLNHALANRATFDKKPSNKWCDECGEKIPHQRQKLGGVKYCVDCQSYLEKKNR